MDDDLTLTFISEVCRIKTRKNQGFQIMNYEVLNQSQISLVSFDENNNKKLYIVQKNL